MRPDWGAAEAAPRHRKKRNDVAIPIGFGKAVRPPGPRRRVRRDVRSWAFLVLHSLRNPAGEALGRNGERKEVSQAVSGRIFRYETVFIL